MGQAQSSSCISFNNGKRSTASQPGSGASTPASSNRRRQNRSGGSTPNLAHQRRRSNNKAASPLVAAVDAASSPAESPPLASTSYAGANVEFTAPLASPDEQLIESKTLVSEEDFPIPPSLNPGILDVKAIEVETDDAYDDDDDDDDDDEDDADSEGANQENLEAAMKLMQRAQAALQEAKKRDDDQLKLAKLMETDQRFLDD